jgi:hypothetical protein
VLGISVYPIVTVRDIIASFPAGDARIGKMEAYLNDYGAERIKP